MGFGIKLLIKKGVVFIMPFLLVIGYCEYRLPEVRNIYNTRRVYLESRLDSIELLALGSSHIMNGVNPFFLSCRAFNLAYSNQTIYYDEALTLKYLTRLSRLKVVILPVSHFTFFTSLEKSKEYWRVYFYRYFWGISCPYTENRFDIRKYSLICLYEPSHAVRLTFQNFNTHDGKLMEQNGFIKNDVISSLKDFSDSAGKEKMKLWESDYNQLIYEEIVGQLTHFLSILRQKQIQVIFITTPLYRTLAQFRSPSFIHINEQTVKNFCVKFNCQYFNFTNDPRFTITDFANNDHLNECGAQKFSKILDAEVLNLYFPSKSVSKKPAGVF